MKKIGIIAVMAVTMLLFSPMSHADPILSCGPQAGVTHYRLEGVDVSYAETSDAAPDTTGNHDLAGIPEGEHQYQFYAGKWWTLVVDGQTQTVIKWGDPTPPFTLGNPGTSNVPSGIEMVLP